MEQKSELKPCPWCGGTPKVLRVDFTDPIEYGVACLNMSCPIRPSAGCFDTEEEAAEAWNSMQEKTCHFVGHFTDYEDEENRYVWECDVCHEKVNPFTYYCPHCGAKAVHYA